MLAGYGDLDITLIAPPWWNEEAGRVRLNKDNTGFKVICLPVIFAGKQFVHFYTGLAGELKKIDPDIIHIEEEPNSASCFQALMLKKRMSLKARTIVFSWQNMRQAWRFPDPRFLFYPFFEKFSLENADYIIAGSRTARDIFLEKGFAGGISVIPQFGINPDQFKRRDASRLKRELGLNKFVIGYLGRLIKMKGVYTLLKAVSGLKHDYKLLIIGSGPDRAGLERVVRESGNIGKVVFKDNIPREQAPDYLNCMDLMVLPSECTVNWEEQFGMVLVEAMACEVPVVGSSCGEIPRVLEDAGIIFQEGDSEDLRSKIEMLITDSGLRSEISSRARKRVMDNYTMRKIAEDTCRLYKDKFGARQKEGIS